MHHSLIAKRRDCSSDESSPSDIPGNTSYSGFSQNSSGPTSLKAQIVVIVLY